METANLGVLAGILISLSFFALIFAVFYLYKRERMAMIERGMDPRLYKPRSAPYQNLKWGLLLIGAGLGLFLANILDNTMMRAIDHNMDNSNPAIYFALIGLFGGAGLVVSYLIEKKNTIDK